MKINNENEKYALHFIFHTNIYISNFMDTCNEKYQNNISTCEETRNMIHDYLSKEYIQVYIDYLIE